MRHSEHIAKIKDNPMTERGNIALQIYLMMKNVGVSPTFITQDRMEAYMKHAIYEADTMLERLYPYQGEFNDIKWAPRDDSPPLSAGYDGIVSDGIQEYKFIVRQDDDAWYCSGDCKLHKGEFPTPEAAMEWANEEWKKIR